MSSHLTSINRTVELDLHAVFACRVLHVCHTAAIIVVGVECITFAIDGLHA